MKCGALIEKLVMLSMAYGKVRYAMAINSNYISVEDEGFFIRNGYGQRTMRSKRNAIREDLIRYSNVMCKQYDICKKQMEPNNILESYKKGHFILSTTDLKMGFKELHLEKSRDKWRPDFMILITSNEIVDCRNMRPKEIRELKKLQRVLRK